MKFSIGRDFLDKGLGLVINVVSSRNQDPVYSNVLIEAEEEGTVKLTTTDLDISVRCSVKADVSVPGSITLPVKKLKDIVGGMMGNEIGVELFSKTKVKLVCGSSDAVLSGIKAESFPKFSVADSERVFEIAQSELASMIRNVAYAQSVDPNRYILNGVYFNFSEEVFAVVATDGRRLATCEHRTEAAEKPISGSFVLPAKTVSELIKQLGSKGNVRIGVSEKQVLFEIDADERPESGLCGKIRIISKVIEGNFPQYKQVIPKESANRMEVEREVFLRSVEFVSKVTTDKYNSVYLDLKPNTLEVSASGGENEAKNKIAVQYNGPEFRIAFNPLFLADPLKALVQDMVSFEFKDELSPGVLKTKNSGFLCVIMPQRK